MSETREDHADRIEAIAARVAAVEANGWPIEMSDCSGFFEGWGPGWAELLESAGRDLKLLLAHLAANDVQVATLTHERDIAWGDLGFTKNDLGNAQHQVATLTAEVERLSAINQHDLAAWEQEAARADAAERDNERLTQERDEARLIADGHVGGLVSNLRARAEAAEARVLTAERELDEARAKSAIDEAGYDHILTTAQALQARVQALETAIYSVACGSCREAIQIAAAALTAPQAADTKEPA